MNIDERVILIVRTRQILFNLRLCNNACDIHEVGTMRNIGTLLIHNLEEGIYDDDYKQAREILERLEKRCLEFFKKKFGYK